MPRYTPMPTTTSVVVKIMSRTASAVCMILVADAGLANSLA